MLLKETKLIFCLDYTELDKAILRGGLDILVKQRNLSQNLLRF